MLLGINADDSERYADPTGKVFSLKPIAIESRKPLTNSLMPENLQKQMTVQEFRDLLAFLQHGSEVSFHHNRTTMKSTVEEIRQRFDNEVDRFSNLQTGQSATIDAPLALELVAEAAAVTTPNATRLLDVGCGAGNYALKVLSRLPNLDVTLVDLSGPMLAKAQERIRAVSRGGLRAIQQDMREIDFGDFGVRYYRGLCHVASFAHRRAVAHDVRQVSPGAGRRWVSLDF